jgi:hypothetical protein
MTRRPGAAKALVEQPGSCLPRTHVSAAAVVGWVTPNGQQEVGLPHCRDPGEHVTRSTGLSPSRTAARRAGVTVAASNVACTQSVCPVQAAPDEGSCLVQLGPAGYC